MFEVTLDLIALRSTDKMWHFVIFRILGLDEQYLTDLAQYQCQAARLTARRGQQGGGGGGGPPSQDRVRSLVDRWKQGRKSLSQVRFCHSEYPVLSLSSAQNTKNSDISRQIATIYAGLGRAHYRNKSCAKFTSRIIYVKRHFNFLRVFYRDNPAISHQ